MSPGTMPLLPWEALLPEVGLVALALILLGLELSLPEGRKRALGGVTLVGLTLILIGALMGPPPEVENGLVRVDRVGMAFRVILLLGGALTAILSVTSRRLPQKGPYYGILVFVLLGMLLMATAVDLVVLYVAIELVGIGAYILAGYRARDGISVEAGLKYLLFGAVASATMLYGMSLLFGLAGETGYAHIAETLRAAPSATATLALMLVLVGLGFKAAMAPMHFWVPDVYHGAPTPVTAFISVASKAAGFAALIRALNLLFPALDGIWSGLVGALSILTMTLGNLFALPQHNAKRLLAYSSVAQAGYVLIGVVAASTWGTAAAVFYLLVYTLTNVAAFAVVAVVGDVLGDEELATFEGLNARSRLLGLAMLVALLSLAGIPPSGGFVGKFFLFAAGMERGLVWVVIAGALNAILALYYYLGLVRRIFSPLPADAHPASLALPRSTRCLLVGLSIAILLMGIIGGPLFEWFRGASLGIALNP